MRRTQIMERRVMSDHVGWCKMAVVRTVSAFDLQRRV